MPWTAETWPIGAALLQFPAVDHTGISANDAHPSAWRRVFREVSSEGFDHVDLTDSWLRPGDLDTERRRELVRALSDSNLRVSAISMVRQSVIDPNPGVAARNLAYTLRNVEAAADIGTTVLCVGLHRPLTRAQQRAEWFWTVPGESDPAGDPAVWGAAVERLQKVGNRAADLGIQISLEMYEDTYLGTADSAVSLVKDIGLANVGLNPDVGNIVRLHRPVESWQEMLAKTLPYTNYWHVKNYYRDHDPATGAYFSAPCPLDSGFISYRTAIGMALEAGFHGPICVEHYGGDGLGVAARNHGYLRRLLAVKLADGR